MPVVRTSKGYGRKKAPPEGYEDIEDTLLEYDNAMKDAMNASHEGKKRQEMQWPIFEITHKRTFSSPKLNPQKSLLPLRPPVTR